MISRNHRQPKPRQTPLRQGHPEEMQAHAQPAHDQARQGVQGRDPPLDEVGHSLAATPYT
jgi:hypothetical protein